MLITRTSPVSGKENTMNLDITQEQLTNHSKGMQVQHAFKNLQPYEREFIRTGLTKEESDTVFDFDND